MDHYQREVVTIDAQADAHQIAECLRESGLGALVVTENDEPIGMVTDRDLLRRVIAPGRDVASTTAKEIMSEPLASVTSNVSLEAILAVMAERGVRRVAVLRDGRLSGLVALDDVFVTLADELSGLADGVRAAFRTEQYAVWAHKRRHEVESRFKELVDQIEHIGGGARDKLLRQVDTIRQHLRSG